MNAETVTCDLTPRGRGAVATIGVRGDLTLLDDFFQAANGNGIAEQDLSRICFGHWGTDSPEDVVCVKFTTTSAELHCHGGIAAVDRILRNLNDRGARTVSQQQWVRSESNLVHAECQIALNLTTTRRTAHHVLRQCSLFPAALQQLLVLSREEQIHSVETLLDFADFGRHLLDPWKIVICGRPNVGKSSLINALLGFERAVVFDQPGTTRDVVNAETAFAGWSVVLSDTAGLRETDSQLESAGIAKAHARMQEADLTVIVLDSTSGVLPEDEALLAAFPRSVLVWNKADMESRFSQPVGSLAVSALNGSGLENLMNEIVQRLVPDEPSADAAFPVTADQVDKLSQLHRLLLAGDDTGFRTLLLAWLS